MIVQSNASLDQIPVALIVPGTSNLKALRFPHTVRIDPDGTNGLRMPTVFLAFQVQAIDKHAIGDPPRGQLSAADLARLEGELRAALGL